MDHTDDARPYMLSATSSFASSPVYVAFTIIWGLLAVSSFAFFHFNRNAALKRRIWTPFIILIGVVFGAFVYFGVGREMPHVRPWIIPAIVFISILNIRTVRFCDSCGRTLNNQSPFSNTTNCPHCQTTPPD